MSHLLVACGLLSALSGTLARHSGLWWRTWWRNDACYHSHDARGEGAIDMTGLSYTVDRTGANPVAVLAGEIDVASVHALEAAITATEQDAAAGADVVLDMTEVTFLDSSGLRVLVTAHDRLNTEAKRLVIRRPPAAVLRVFEVTGLLSTIVIDD